MRLVDDSQRHAEPQALEVANLLRQLNDLREEVDLEPELAALARLGPLAVDGEDAARHAQVPLLHLPRPVVKDLLGGELHPEAVAVRLQLLTLDVVFPALAQHVLDPLHVGLQDLHG